MFDWWTTVDTWIVVIGALSAMSCAILGNYLLLRGMSMMGDAISHAVLPGLAAAFLITGSRDNITMLFGALIIGVVTAILIQAVTRYGKLDEGASMGVIFTALFALGLILIRKGASHVDLDPGCVLYGAVELTPFSEMQVFGYYIPKALFMNGFVFLANVFFVGILYKELKISSFDPDLATSLGFSSQLMHYLLMGFVAATTVACFQVVGSILVIAMLIIPPATAFLLTRKLSLMILLSLIFGLSAAVFGHIGAVEIPPLLGYEKSASTAGMMAVASGFIFLIVWVISPNQGLVSRIVNRWNVLIKIVRDDLLLGIIRFEEQFKRPATRSELNYVFTDSPLFSRLALMRLKNRHQVKIVSGNFKLTERGRKNAKKLLRAHRLWESYLVKNIGIREDHVHSTAERLEHITDEAMRERLALQLGDPKMDPHEKAIPEEEQPKI